MVATPYMKQNLGPHYDVLCLWSCSRNIDHIELTIFAAGVRLWTVFILIIGLI